MWCRIRELVDENIDELPMLTERESHTSKFNAEIMLVDKEFNKAIALENENVEN